MIIPQNHSLHGNLQCNSQCMSHSHIIHISLLFLFWIQDSKTHDLPHTSQVWSQQWWLIASKGRTAETDMSADWLSYDQSPYKTSQTLILLVIKKKKTTTYIAWLRAVRSPHHPLIATTDRQQHNQVHTRLNPVLACCWHEPVCSAVSRCHDIRDLCVFKLTDVFDAFAVCSARWKSVE